jgi:hypothetical protein
LGSVAFPSSVAGLDPRPRRHTSASANGRSRSGPNPDHVQIRILAIVAVFICDECHVGSRISKPSAQERRLRVDPHLERDRLCVTSALLAFWAFTPADCTREHSVQVEKSTVEIGQTLDAYGRSSNRRCLEVNRVAGLAGYWPSHGACI